MHIPLARVADDKKMPINGKRRLVISGGARTIFRAVAFQVIVLLIIADMCFAREWFVRPSGGAYGSGRGASYDNAWSGMTSIRWGPRGLTEGDTLYICGSHDETLRVGASGRSGSSITIRGDYAGAPGIIDVMYNHDNCVNMASRKYIILHGLTLRHSRTTAVFAQNAENCEIKDCVFRAIGKGTDTDNYGIDARYSGSMRISLNSMDRSEGPFNASGIVVNLFGRANTSPGVSYVENNRITGIEVDAVVTGNNVVVTRNTIGNLLNKATHSDGIVVQGSNVTVKRNTVYDCTQCVYVNSFDYGPGSESVCDNVAVLGNLIYGTAAAHKTGVNGISAWVFGAGLASINGLKIYNNTIADCNFNGITLGDKQGGRLKNVNIMNNIIINSGGGNGCINFNTAAANVSIDYNLTYSSNSGRNWKWNGRTRTLPEMRGLGFEEHGIAQVSPGFAKYAAGAAGNVFTLEKNSPAIDAGLNLGTAIGKELEFLRNTHGKAWHMGAF